MRADCDHYTGCCYKVIGTEEQVDNEKQALLSYDISVTGWDLE